MENDRSFVSLLGDPKTATSRSHGDKPSVPEEMAKALDASSKDIRHGRTEDIGEFVKDRRAKLKAHLDRKAASRR